MKQYSVISLLVVLGLILTACGGNNNSNNRTNSQSEGENLGLVLVWSMDGDEVTQGTAPFDLYYDHGSYYVDFYGEKCRVKKVNPIYVGGTELCYSFTTSKVGQYTYYIEDVSDSSKRFYSN